MDPKKQNKKQIYRQREQTGGCQKRGGGGYKIAEED